MREKVGEREEGSEGGREEEGGKERKRQSSGTLNFF